jgi:hypothetical protein
MNMNMLGPQELNSISNYVDNVKPARLARNVFRRNQDVGFKYYAKLKMAFLRRDFFGFVKSLSETEIRRFCADIRAFKR